MSRWWPMHNILVYSDLSLKSLPWLNHFPYAMLNLFWPIEVEHQGKEKNIITDHHLLRWKTKGNLQLLLGLLIGLTRFCVIFQHPSVNTMNMHAQHGQTAGVGQWSTGFYLELNLWKQMLICDCRLQQRRALMVAQGPRLSFPQASCKVNAFQWGAHVTESFWSFPSTVPFVAVETRIWLTGCKTETQIWIHKILKSDE